MGKMTSRRGKLVAFSSLGAVLAVLAALGVGYRDVGKEYWYIFRFHTGDDDQKKAALERLGAMRSARAVPYLLRSWNEEEDQSETLRGVLMSIGPGAVPALIRALDLKEPPAYRAWSARVLGHIDPPAVSAVPRLVEMLREHDVGLRWAACKGLAGIGSPAVPALIACLREDQEESWVPVAAAYALCKMGPSAEAAVPALIEALRSDDYALRIRACVALGGIGPPAKEAKTALKRKLEDEDLQVRQAATEALAKVSPAES